MSDSAFQRLLQAMPMFEDLIHMMDDDVMMSRLPVASNTIWDQLWCVVGGRESYAGAISLGKWGGFSCSLTAEDRGSMARVARALLTSRELMTDTGGDSPESRFVLDCLLHETQHQGQLIRYVYGLELTFPKSWRDRWGL